MCNMGARRMTELNNSRLITILPPNLQPDAAVQSVCYAFDRAFWRFAERMKKLIVLSDLKNQPEEIYDALALDWKVIGYKRSMPLSQKRNMVLDAKISQMDRGTTGRVEKLMREVFGDAQLEEWFDYGGNPYLFRIVSSNPSLQDTDAEYFVSVLEQVKNLRSHLEEIVVRLGLDSEVFAGGAIQAGYYDVIE